MLIVEMKQLLLLIKEQLLKYLLKINERMDER